MNSILTSSKFRYLVSGGATFASEYLVFAILIQTTNLLVLSNTLSFIFGLSVSFLLHKFWSFKGDHNVDARKQILGFVMLAATNLAVINILVFFFVTYLSLGPLMAKAVVMIAVVVWNYIIFNTILFKTKS